MLARDRSHWALVLWGMRRHGACATAVLLAFFGAGCGTSDDDANGPESFVAGGVPLGTHVPPLVQRACRQAQQEVRIHVTCPGLVPQGPLRKTVGLWGGFALDRSLWLITFNNGDDGSRRYLHWMMGAGQRSSVRRYLLSDVANEVKGTPTKVGESRAGSRTVVTYRYPPHPAGGPNGGHTAAFVPCGDELVFASLHGSRTSATEKLAIALAEMAGCP